MTAADRRDPTNLLSRDGDDIDPSDIVRILIGYYDKRTDRFVPGLLSTVHALKIGQEIEQRIVRYCVYFIAIVSLFRFFGIDNATSLIKLFGH